MRTHYRWLLSSITACMLLPLSTASFALAFNIVPTPGTTLPTTISPGSTAAASYTVTNNTTRTLAGNSVRYLPPNVAIDASGTTCSPSDNFALASGASCALALTVSGAVDANDPDQHHHLFVCPSGSPACSGTLYPLNVTVSGGSPSAGTVGCGLAGGTNNGNNAPTLAQNFNVGLPITDWSNVTVPGQTTFGFYNTVTCGQAGTSPYIALAVGTDNNTNNGTIAQSTDSGASWNLVTISGLATNTDFSSASCTGNGPATMCVAAGSNESTTVPLIVQTTNNGASWSFVTVPGIPTNPYFNTTSCSRGSSPICVAGGQSAFTTPVLVQTTNGGTNWSVATVSGLPTTDVIYGSSSCIGSGSSATCVATAVNTSTSTSYLVQTPNGGASWSVVYTASTTSLGSVSCASNGSATLCVAAGQTTSKLPVLLQSTNAGATWTPVTVPGGETDVTGDATSCANSGSSFMCIASYSSHLFGSSLIQTTNGGASWNVAPLPGVASGAAYGGLNCFSNGAVAACTVGGSDSSGDPLLLQTTDGGTTWSTASVSGGPSQGEYGSTSLG